MNNFSDIKNLRAKLIEESLAVAICQGDELYTEKDRGVKPIIKHYDLGHLTKASLCDKVIGKASAMFMVAGGAKRVHGLVISQPALKVFLDRGVEVSYDEVVPNIINRTGDDLCPMEKTVLEEDDLEVGMAKVRAKVQELAARG